MNRVTIVGPWPRPTGGVSTFLSRLIKKDNGRLICELIDVYPGKKDEWKIENITHNVTPFCGFMKWIWLWFKVSFSQGSVVHFNFSGANSLLFCLFPLRINRAWILTLHNGNLKNPKGVIGLIYRIAINRFREVISLSEYQREFYLSIGRNSVLESTSYIYHVEFSKIETEIYRSWRVKSAGFRNLFVASGYPTIIYNHFKTIEYVTRHNNSFLALFIYGPDTERLLETLLSFNKLKNCIVFYECSEIEFNDILSRSHVYLRPNKVDSFGIAIADAINLSLTVFASDVCKRYPGTHVFSSLDEYSKLIDTYIEDKNKIRPVNVKTGLDCYGALMKTYHHAIIQ